MTSSLASSFFALIISRKVRKEKGRATKRQGRRDEKKKVKSESAAMYLLLAKVLKLEAGHAGMLAETLAMPSLCSI